MNDRDTGAEAAPMAKEFEGYVRGCVLPARLGDSVELRDQPIQLLRIPHSIDALRESSAVA